LKSILKYGILVVAVAVSPVSAEIAESFGLGPRMVGFSGAGVASVSDWTATFYNIAGVTSPYTDRGFFGNQGSSQTAAGKIKLLRDDGSLQSNEKGSTDAVDKKLEAELLAETNKPTHELGMNYLFQASLPTLAPSRTNAKIAKNMDLATKNMVYGAVQLGLIFDTRTLFNTPKNMPIRMGLAISLRDNGTVATVNDTGAETYNFLRLGREAQRILIMTGIGAQVWKDRLSVGLGFNTFTGGKGSFNMSDVQIDPTGKFQTPNAQTQMDLTPAGAPTAGIQYRHNIKNRILLAGLSWRGETYMLMDPLDAGATTQLLQVDMPLRLSILDFFSPHTFTLGATYIHDDSLKISLDTEFQWWNRFEVNGARKIYMSTVGMSFQKFNNIFLVRLGAEAKPGKYIQKIQDLPLLARVGFSYTPAFTPDQTGYSNFLDNDKIAYSLGASYFLNSNSVVKAPVEIIFGFQHQIWLSRSTVKSGPVLTTTLPVSDPVNQPDYKYSVHVIVVSLGALVKF